MTATRRIGAEDSTTRAALLDAAQRLMLLEGYAAVTSRRVAAQAGLKPQLVHYYFRTMDDLFIAVVRRGAEQNLERLRRAIASPQPLWSLWELSSDPTGTALTIELTALANHRKEIRAELLAYATEFRRQQAEAIAEAIAGYGSEQTMSPEASSVLLDGVARFLVMEGDIGLTAGHDEVRAIVEARLTELEGPRR